MNKFSFVVVFTWMLAIVCVQSAVDHERRLLEFLEDRIPKHTLPSLQNDTGINLIAKHTSIDLKKQNWLRVRGGFRKGGVDAFSSEIRFPADPKGVLFVLF